MVNKGIESPITLNNIVFDDILVFVLFSACQKTENDIVFRNLNISNNLDSWFLTIHLSSCVAYRQWETESSGENEFGLQLVWFPEI